MDADELDAIIASVRAFVRREVVPLEDEIEERDEVPDRLRAQAREMGLFGYALPEAYGGLGFSMTEEVRLAFELGWTSAAFRSMFGTNNGIAGQVLVNYGTDEQRDRWLPRLAAGEAVACFALTEIEAGSDPSGMRTRAVRDGNGYVLTGAKRYITNAPNADLLVVFAKTDPDAPGIRGISAFAVPAGTPGLSIGPRDKKMGQSGAWTADVYLDDVRVGADALIGGREGDGFVAAMRSLAKGRLHIAAIAVGLAERMIDESVRYAAETRQGGKPIGTHQLVQALLADSYAEARAARSMVVEAAASYDAGGDQRLGPAAAKLFCTEMCDRVADRAVQVHGGAGYMRTVPVERFYRDSRLFRIYEGTSEIQKVVIARHLLDGIEKETG